MTQLHLVSAAVLAGTVVIVGAAVVGAVGVVVVVIVMLALLKLLVVCLFAMLWGVCLKECVCQKC